MSLYIFYTYRSNWLHKIKICYLQSYATEYATDIRIIELVLHCNDEDWTRFFCMKVYYYFLNRYRPPVIKTINQNIHTFEDPYKVLHNLVRIFMVLHCVYFPTKVSRLCYLPYNFLFINQNTVHYKNCAPGSRLICTYIWLVYIIWYAAPAVWPWTYYWYPIFKYSRVPL